MEKRRYSRKRVCQDVDGKENDDVDFQRLKKSKKAKLTGEKHFYNVTSDKDMAKISNGFVPPNT